MITLQTLLESLPVVLPLGLIVGITMGALGGGGAVIAVPALVYLLHQPPAAATTGSLIVVGVTAIVSVLQHHRAGRVQWRDGIVFGLVGLIGSTVGALAAHWTRPETLLALFAGLLFVVAGLMIRRLRGARDEPVRRGLPAVALAAIGVGLLTGFFGVGGGFAIVPALTLVMGYEMPEAVGTSLLVIAINCATSLTTKIALGARELDLGLLAVFAACAVVGGLLGGRLTRTVPASRLQAAFSVMLLVIATVMAVQNWPRLLA